MSFLLTGTISGLPEAISELAKLEARSQKAVATAMGYVVKQGEGIVKGKASGRPGPRAVTGDYRRSIVGDTETSGSVIFGQIGTNAAQGARLEMGFVGVDVLGRRYNQPPFPHFGPSVPEITAVAEQLVAAAIETAFAA